MFLYPKSYDIIVIGAGHAGCEAALASARRGHPTLLITGNLDMIGHMSCNPAIGGLGKGHLVREIDALGGEMAKIADATGIQFRRLNSKKGPAVQGTRAQSDMYLYKQHMRVILEDTPNLDIKQGVVARLMTETGRVTGIETGTGEGYRAKAVIVTTGTFLRGLCHVGLKNFSGGRAGDFAAMTLSESLASVGLELGRLKTGTVPRLDAKTIDWSHLEPQWGDDPAPRFSFSPRTTLQPQVPCYITYTNSKTHEIILDNLDRSPMYTGVIEGTGPRYCPSIEDKVKRFSTKDRHQIFLEPEGLTTREIYPNGVSTSLPIDVQLAFLRSIPGLEHVEIMRPGYAVEYDFAHPEQLSLTLETKCCENLFLAGQINGTSGYEEAAAQGLMAGINASLKVRNEAPLILRRDEAYIGVMIDDLVTKGVREPYRMFTARAEYRLLLREDNADLRLRDIGRRLGLVNDSDYARFQEKKTRIAQLEKSLKATLINPTDAWNRVLDDLSIPAMKKTHSLLDLLRRPEVTMSTLKTSFSAAYETGVPHSDHDPDLDVEAEEQVEIHTKYAGYIAREEERIAHLSKMETLAIPEMFDFKTVHGLKTEEVEKLSRIRPASLGQAGRISGVTPSALSILLIHLKKKSRLESGIRDS